MQVNRCKYIVRTNLPKTNGQYLNSIDLLNVGYMAGRFGVDLTGNPQVNYIPIQTQDGVIVNVNSCTAGLLESNLSQAGINFNRIA